MNPIQSHKTGFSQNGLLNQAARQASAQPLASGSPAMVPNGFRWAKRDLPLLWHAPGFDSALLTEVMNEWTEASQGKVQFEAAYRVDSAKLSFEWIDHTVIGRDYEVGHTNRRVQDGQIILANISMIRSPAIDRHLSPAQQNQRLRTTLLHEIGHAIGVEHSSNPIDVMYYRGWQNEHLSVNDAQRVRLMYASY
jgi:predicted Zn-dependent protease